MSKGGVYSDVYKQDSPDGGWKPIHDQGSSLSIDPESLHAKRFDFSEESVRKGFIRKVYLILTAQLMVTLGVIALFLFNQPTKDFTERNPQILFFAVFATLIIVISMACCESARRTFPLNFICLGVFTLAESVLLGAFACTYNINEVFTAIGITIILCLSLSIFAMQTKYDFTVFGGILLVSLLGLIIIGFVGIFWPSYIYQMIFASLGALLGCFFLIYDTQLMVGGDHKYAINPEEYIFGALNLYMDVIRIFIYVLRLIGGGRK